MRPFRPRDLTIVLFALAALAVLSVAGVFLVPPTEAEEDGSSYSVTPRGARAAFLTLQQLGYRVERSFEPVTAITRDPSGVLLVFADPIEPPSDQDRHALQAFLDRGGVVVAAGRGAIAFFGGRTPREEARRDEQVGRPSRVADSREYRPAIADTLTRGVASIDVAPEAQPSRAPTGYIPVFGTDADAPVRIARIGPGRAIWMSSATPFGNDAIVRHGNLQFLLNAAGAPSERTILWDEKYHGHARSIWSYMARTPLPWALAQLGLIALTAAATFSRRRGPVRAKVIDPRTSPMEFVDTMGALYAQVKADGPSVDAARARLRRLLADATGLPAGCTDTALARAAAPRVAMEPEALAALLGASRAGEGRSALEIVQGLQAVAATLARQQRGAQVLNTE